MNIDTLRVQHTYGKILVSQVNTYQSLTARNIARLTESAIEIQGLILQLAVAIQNLNDATRIIFNNK